MRFETKKSEFKDKNTLEKNTCIKTNSLFKIKQFMFFSLSFKTWKRRISLSNNLFKLIKLLTTISLHKCLHLLYFSMSVRQRGIYQIIIMSLKSGNSSAMMVWQPLCLIHHWDYLGLESETSGLQKRCYEQVVCEFKWLERDFSSVMMDTSLKGEGWQKLKREIRKKMSTDRSHKQVSYRLTLIPLGHAGCKGNLEHAVTLIDLVQAVKDLTHLLWV